MKNKRQLFAHQRVPNHEEASQHENESNAASKQVSSKVLKGEGLFSRLFFNWISCVLQYGSQHPIDTNHLPHLHPSHHPQLEFNALQKQLRTISHSSRQAFTLITSISKVYKVTLIYIAVLALVMTVLSMAAPSLTHLIISYVKLAPSERSISQGLLLVAAAGGLALAKAITQSHLYFKFAVFGFNLSNTLSLLIFSKALKYPAVSHNKYSLAQIINFSQVDAQRMTSMGPQLTAVLYTPLQICIGVYLMYSYIGASFAAGLCTMIGLIALTLHLAKRIGNINKQTNQAKDKRTKITQEMLEIIRFIKVNTLQKFFFRKVDQRRNEELQSNKRRGRMDVLVVFIFFVSCPLIVFLTFSTFTALGNSIDATIAFSTIIIFNILQSPLRQFPNALSNAIQMFSSLKRIEQFLFSAEINQDHAILCQDKEIAIRITDGTFGWVTHREEKQKATKKVNKNSPIKVTQSQSLETNNRYVIDDHESMDSSKANIFDIQHDDDSYIPIFRRINFSIKNGTFALILGDIGSGKSSLLLSILNEMKSPTNTTISLGNSIAYCSQRPCIISGTVRDNILFGLPYEKGRFDETIYLSALGQDLKQLVKGELTEIGEKGVNLSGGQKMRVALARAIYSNREIMLLDDIVSAVDAAIAEFIVKVTLRGFLRGKTILLATHAVKFAEFADQIIIMHQGAITRKGSFKEIHNTYEFQEISKSISQQTTPANELQQQKQISQQQKKVKQTLQLLKQKSAVAVENYYAAKAVQNLIIPQDHHRGEIETSVLSEYLQQNGGSMFVIFVFIAMLGWLLLSIFSSMQMEKWCSDLEHSNFYLYLYLALSIGASLCAFGRSLIIVISGFKQGRQIHKQIIKALLYASLNEFYQRVPVGRIMNRLTKDMRELDESIGNSLTSFLNNSFTLAATIIICIYGSTLLMILPVLFVMHLCNKLRKYYMQTQREIMRIEGKTNSPIAQGFVSAMHGLPTIRAYKAQDLFLQEQITRIQTNKRSRITREALQSWFAFRLTILSFFISILSIAFALIATSSSPALVGLLLSYALTLNDDIITLTFSWASLQTRFVAIERIYSFMKIEPEQHYRQYCQDWSPEEEGAIQCAKQGKIEFKEVSIKYRNDLPDALHTLSLQVAAGEKVGIVGRTGAGKSTLFNALLKIIDPYSGSILIDDVDYQSISVKDLRNSITVIDQEPVIMNSTFRENLDPEGVSNDDDLSRLLKECQLYEIVTRRGGLDGKIDNRSLSAGEKQLICICRALLKKSKIVLIDEATANVDLKNDKIIQEIVGRHLKESTVLTIAHRLSTLSQVDRMLVIGAGKILEIGSPAELRHRAGGMYAQMLRKQKSQLLA